MIYSIQLLELYYKKGKLTMPFKKMERPNLPPRHWILVGYPGSGKSTFATQMRTPLLPIDADHRFEEVVHLAQGDVYELSTNPADSVDPETIFRLLKQNMPNSGVATVVVDSLTTIITPKVVQAVIDNDAGRSRNRMAAFKDKALSMRLLQDAVTMWGTDVLWIYHLQDSRDEQAREVTKATLSATERARLYRSVNLELHIIQERNRRGIKVVWARRGRSGMTLWDDTSKWVGMPEKIEQAVYGGLSIEDQKKIEQEAPAVFPTEEAAIEWALTTYPGLFKNVNHGKNAFNLIKKAAPDKGLAEWSLAWVEDVDRRASEMKVKEQVASGEAEPAQPEEPAQSSQAEDEEPLEERFDFTLFCDQVTTRLPFFQSLDEIVTTLKALKLDYDPDKEEHLFDCLNAHVEALPAFETLKALLEQVHKDFGLEEAAAKARLKEMGFTSFPRDGNGEAKLRSRRMYAALGQAVANDKAAQTEEEPL